MEYVIRFISRGSVLTFGGLGSAVCELLGEKLPTKVKRLGLRDFGESGTPKELYQKFGFSPEGIKNDIKNTFDE